MVRLPAEQVFRVYPPVVDAVYRALAHADHTPVLDRDVETVPVRVQNGCGLYPGVHLVFGDPRL